MALVPFADKHIAAWQQAVDMTAVSPSPLAGPELGSTMIRSWGSTHLKFANGLVIPFAHERTTHAKIVASDVYTGVPINGLLGMTEMNETTWTAIEELPRRCVLTLDVPEDTYRTNRERWNALHFSAEERYCYHRIALPATYDEWFARPDVKRQNIRRAQQAGLTVTIGGAELLESFYQLYLQSYSRWKDRRTASLAHGLQRFQRMFDLPGSQARITVARKQQQVVAAVIFCNYRRTAGYLYGGADFNFQELRPNNLIHAEIVRYLIEQGVSEYNLGMSLGQKELEHFKETLGAKIFFSVSLRRHRFPRLQHLLSRPPTPD
jgi:hypothetical protein